MKNFKRPILAPTISYSQCHYTIDMQDSFGDGWNGASVDVNVNGIQATSFGFTNGNNSTDSLFTLNGDIVEFNFTSGNWDTEITFQVYDPSGVQILDIGPFANNDGNDGFLLTDTSNSTCIPQNVTVTFRVDMNNALATFTTPEVNGSWNNWSAGTPMSDANGDGVWDATIPLLSGNYEYKFAADGWTIQEMNDPNGSCTIGDPNFTNRVLVVNDDGKIAALNVDGSKNTFCFTELNGLHAIMKTMYIREYAMYSYEILNKIVNYEF